MLEKIEKLSKVEIGIEKIPIYTFFGKKEIIKLSDFSYGTWLIFNFNKPVYYINTFDPEQYELNKLIESVVLTIEKLIKKINAKNSVSYTLGQNFFGIKNYRRAKYDKIEVYKFPFVVLADGIDN